MSTGSNDPPQPRLGYQNKLLSLSRFAIVHGLSRILPVYIVNEYPKSGATWISNMLARALDLPFRDNEFPQIEASIVKGQFFNRGLMGKTLVVWRDGRDVMISFYHHNYFKFVDIPINHKRVEFMRENYPFEDYDDVKTNLPAFVEQQLTNSLSPRFTWPEFVAKWRKYDDLVHVTYEDMRADAASELRRIASELAGKELSGSKAQAIVEEFSIDRIKKSQTKGERHFVRKGKVGGWRELFTPECSEIFERYAGDALDLAGYPRDERIH